MAWTDRTTISSYELRVTGYECESTDLHGFAGFDLTVRDRRRRASDRRDDVGELGDAQQCQAEPERQQRADDGQAHAAI